MNDIFNFRRFGLLISKDFRENWKKYGLQFLTLFGIMAVWMTWNFYNRFQYLQKYPSNNENIDIQLLQSLSILFLGFGIFFASTLMNPMREKTMRISFLSTPVSNFEKYISRWLIVTIGYIIAFFIALWIADVVRVAFMSYKYPEIGFKFIDFSRLVKPEIENSSRNYAFFNKSYFILWVSIYALLQSLFLLGTTFWEKASFIKTFSASAVIIFLYIYLNRIMIQIFNHDINSFGGKFSYYVSNLLNNPSDNDVMLLSTCIFIFITIFCWVIAFFRFRESEIINRL